MGLDYLVGMVSTSNPIHCRSGVGRGVSLQSGISIDCNGSMSFCVQRYVFSKTEKILCNTKQSKGRTVTPRSYSLGMKNCVVTVYYAKRKFKRVVSSKVGKVRVSKYMSYDSSEPYRRLFTANVIENKSVARVIRRVGDYGSGS